MFKKIMTCFLMFVCLLSYMPVSNAGVIKKTIKMIAVKKLAKSTIKASENKAQSLAEREVLAKNPLVKGEMKVGKYKKLLLERDKTPPNSYNERLEAHHIPPTDYIKSLGVKKSDGIAVEMQRARHTFTESFGNKSDLTKSPRDMLAKSVKDWKNKYRYDKNTYKDAIIKAKEVIKQNKEDHKTIYEKVKK